MIVVDIDGFGLSILMDHGGRMPLVYQFTCNRLSLMVKVICGRIVHILTARLTTTSETLMYIYSKPVNC